MSTPLRISIDVSAVPAKPAGAGRYVIELVSALAQHDDADKFDFHLIARRGDTDRWRQLYPGATVHAWAPASRPLRLLWEQVLLGPKLQRLGVALHHGPHYTMPRFSRVRGSGSRFKRLVTIHDLTFFSHPELHERSKAVVFRHAVRRAAASADATVCVSEFTASQFRAELRPRHQVAVAPHGIDPLQFSPTPTAADATLYDRLGIHPPFVCFVGTVEPRKDVVGLIAAFEILAGKDPELQLVIAGQDGWGIAPVLQALRESPHRDRIHRLGYVDDADVAALYRGADVVVYPSREEGFGLPVLEALACGAVVVTTKATVMAEIAAGSALLVDYGDVASLVAALMAGRPPRGPQQRRAGLEVAAAYTWQACAAVHLRLYRDLTAGSGR